MRKIHRLLCRLLGVLSTLLLACVAPPVRSLCEVPMFGTEAEKRAAICACRKGFGMKAERYYRLPGGQTIDVLLVIGNTPGMAAKQRALAEIADWRWLLLSPFLDLHLGVVSTDIGSWTAEGTPFAQPAGACDSFAGDDGVLQAVSCWDRPGQTSAAQAACAAVCPDRRFGIRDGRRYLASELGRRNAVSAPELDVRTGQTYDRGMEYALRCLLPLGESGCTISSPLEAAKRALDGHRRENTGFRRPEAPLVILFLTDRDDCSMQLARRAENDPATRRCDTPDRSASPLCFAPGPYRCLAADRLCDQPWNQSGDKSYCVQRSDSPLVPVESYLQFFIEVAGGPERLYLDALSATPALGQGAPISAQLPVGASEVAALSLTPACQSPSDPEFFGLPQHRLSAVRAPWLRVNGAAARPTPPSICEPSKYDLILPLLSLGPRSPWPACVGGMVQRSPMGQPICLVGYVPPDEPRSLPDRLFPVCSAPCCAAFARSQLGEPDDPPVMAACEPEPETCYCVATPQPQVCPQWAGEECVAIWPKSGVAPPPGYGISIRCALSASQAPACSP